MGLTTSHADWPTRIYVVRHGETEENLLGIHQGHGIQGRLSRQGVEDATELAAHLATVRFDALFTGPAGRATATADILAERLRPAVTIHEPRLAAKNSGHLSGQRRDLIEQEAARVGTPIHLFKTPGGESSVDVQHRHVGLWNELAARPGTFLLVGHGAGIALLLLHLTGHDYDRFHQYVHGSAHRTVIDAGVVGHHILEVNAPPRA
ncbi:MAG TPA: histidine phosphatase family protein [Actinocrinis sp.]|uniref:histidine phosphatase family protein n=1 Tax=Actinocrinis sp. TaxID=1920516 RepID=UPI002DDCFC3A|nr:histidine phosphatase family protein [Actinocrinis sp.]HEV2347017.1 histidine phosphatase family protein [Actinocrinis sp.]